jgi:hypothetical protein
VGMGRDCRGVGGVCLGGGVVTVFSSLGELCDSIVSAIVREEGRPLDDTNPGDLRDAPWFPGEPPIVDGTPYRVVSRRTHYDKTPVAYRLQSGNNEPFWNPRSRAEGLAGAFHVVALHVAELNSLAELISDWAPPVENKTSVYLANVQKWTGITDSSVPLVSLISPAPQAGQGMSE